MEAMSLDIRAEAERLAQQAHEIRHDRAVDEIEAALYRQREIGCTLQHDKAYQRGREDGAREEREACAKLLDELAYRSQTNVTFGYRHAAQAIRARGEKP